MYQYCCLILLLCLSITSSAPIQITAQSGTKFILFPPIFSKQTILSLCFIYEGKISSFGWEYSHDLNRLKLTENENITSTYVENCYGADTLDVLEAWLSEGLCSVVVGTSNSQGQYLQIYSMIYRDVYFIMVDGSLIGNNTINISCRPYEYRFQMGILAGLMSNTGEACFVTGPFVSSGRVRQAANAFYAGLKIGNKYRKSPLPNVTLHIFPTEAWTNFTLAIKGVELCKSDSNSDILMDNLYGQSLQIWLRDEIVNEIITGKQRFVGGLSTESDIRVLVGETVLTSGISLFYNAYSQVINSILSNTFVGNQSLSFGRAQNSIQLTRFSEFVPPDYGYIVNSITDLYFQNNSMLFCHPDLYILPNITCPTDSQLIKSTLLFPGIIKHDTVSLPPLEIPFPVYIEWDSPLGIGIALIAAIGLTYTMVLMILTIIYREHPAIYRIQVPFCILTQIGAFLAYIFLLTFPGIPVVSKCMSRSWLLGFAFIILYLPLLLKATVIRSVLRISKKPKKYAKIRKEHLIGGLSFFIIIEVLINVLWDTISPSKVITLSNAGYLLPNQVEIYCDSGVYADVFYGISLGEKILVLLYGCFLAWDMRGLKKYGGKKLSSYNESKEIFGIIYTLFLCVIFCVLALVLLDLNQTVKTTGEGLLTITVFIVTTITLSLLFPRRLWISITITPDDFKSKMDQDVTDSDKPQSTNSSQAGSIS